MLKEMRLRAVASLASSSSQLLTDKTLEERLLNPSFHPFSSGALSSLLKIWEKQSTEKQEKAGAQGWIDGTQGEVINSELCWSWFPQDHLAAFQNASNEVQSDLLSCWRTNAKQLWGYTLTSVLIHQPVLRLKEYSCAVRGYQRGILHYTDGISASSVHDRVG